MTSKVAIIDYEAGNLKSVAKALECVGAQVVVTRDPKVIAASDKIVLPGVGSFGHCMDNLSRFDLVDVMTKEIKSGKSFLGICLGMQLLFESSDESPGVSGLGVLKGSVKKFSFNGEYKVPHMGWNNVKQRQSSQFFDGIPDDGDFYFVHSYYVEPQDPQVIASVTDYGFEFCSAVAYKNIFACQFHPEKSQAIGLGLLANFLKF